MSQENCHHLYPLLGESEDIVSESTLDLHLGELQLPKESGKDGEEERGRGRTVRRMKDEREEGSSPVLLP